MNKELLNKLRGLKLRILGDSFKNSQQYLSQLTSDYIGFMSMYDGGVGFIGENDNYLDLWTSENVSKLNPYFPKEEFSNQVIIIGSNGSGTLYGYDLVDKLFFETDEYQMNRNELTRCGTTFLDLIEYIEKKKD